MKKIKTWVLCATAPGDSFATINAVKSFLQRSSGFEIHLCLSVQCKNDENVLREEFPFADVYYPNLHLDDKQKMHPRYRSIIHSKILNQSWQRKIITDYYVILDNDIVLLNDFVFADIVNQMKLNEFVLYGTEYPRKNPIRLFQKNYKEKPQNIANCIFCIMEGKYYENESKLCGFEELAKNSKDPTFKNQDECLINKQIDTGFNIYLKPVLQKRKIYTLKCKIERSISKFLMFYKKTNRGNNASEFYTDKENRIILRHFKKLSIFSNKAKAEEEYKRWLKKDL